MVRLILTLLAGYLLIFGCSRSESPEEAAKNEAQREEYRKANERIKKAREDAYRERDEADAVIRDVNAKRREELEKASKNVRTTNSNGMRIDRYVLKKGGVITCTTDISGSAPAMFDCDGNL